MPTSIIAAVAADAIATAVADAVIFDIVAATTLDWVATYAVIQAGTSFIAGSLIRGSLSSGSDSNQTSVQGFTAQAQARTHIVRSSVANRNLIYGRAMTSGPLVFAATSDDNATLHLVVALAGHECDAVEQVYFNDEAIGTLDGNGNVTTGTYAGKAKVNIHLGGSAQVADADLVAAGVGWSADHVGHGVCYLYVRLTWDRDVYPRGIPNIKAVVRGKKLYDPRSDTTAWSDNWALAVRDYLASPLGLGCSTAEINDTAAAAAANIADEDVALAAGGTEKRYTANGVIDTGSTPKANMQGLLSAGAGTVTWPAGVYTLTAGAYVAPSITLAEADLRGAIRVRARPSRQDLYNAVKGTFVDPAQGWQPVDFPAIESATYAAQDGDETIWHDVAYPLTTSSATAQRLSKIALEKSRQGITVDAPFKLGAFKIGVRDTVRLTVGYLGWSAKEFVVTAWKFNENGGVDLTLQEEAAACYAWSAEETIADPAPDTALPDPFSVDPPGVPNVSEALYETTGSAGVKAKATISVAPHPDAFVAFYQFEWSEAGAADWKFLGRSTSASIDVLDVVPGVYDVRVKVINGIGVSSAYAVRSNVEILGLAAIPADVTGLSLQAAGGLAILTWALHPDLDVRIGGRIRVRHSNALAGATWETSVSIGEAVAGNTTVAVLPLKEGTYLVRAEDSGGRLSANAAMVSTKQASALAWSPLTTVQEDDDFTGTHSGTFTEGGLLILGGGTLFDSLGGLFDDITGMLDYAEGAATAGTYDFATGMDLGSVQAVRLTSLIASDSINIGTLFDAREGLLDAWQGDFDGTLGAPVDAWVEVRETDDDPAGTPTWSAWKRLDAAEFNARAFDFRAQLTSDDPNYTIRLSQLRVAAANL